MQSRHCCWCPCRNSQKQVTRQVTMTRGASGSVFLQGGPPLITVACATSALQLLSCAHCVARHNRPEWLPLRFQGCTNILDFEFFMLINLFSRKLLRLKVYSFHSLNKGTKVGFPARHSLLFVLTVFLYTFFCLQGKEGALRARFCFCQILDSVLDTFLLQEQDLKRMHISLILE